MSVLALTRSRPTVGTPLWWLVTLEERLRQRQPLMLKMDRYYRGEHTLPFLAESHEKKTRMMQEFRLLLEESRSNFMRLVVDAEHERLAVEGFRLSAETDATSDKQAWQMWQANDMDQHSQTAFLESLIKGVSYLSVWEDDDEDGFADIEVEDPLQTIVAYEGDNPGRQRLAALKVWLDENAGERRANVYMPDGIYKFSAPAELPSMVLPTIGEQILVPWVELEDAFAPNKLGVVPIIPLRNRPRLLMQRGNEGESEIADIVRIQNQVNAFLFLLALAGYFGAHRQRWAIGLKMELDADGNQVEPFDTRIDTLWQTEDPGVKFGEFAQTDLTGYIKAIEQKIMHIAVTTRTPRHYLFAEGQSPSGDAIQSAESGLVKKVIRQQKPFGEGFEEAIRLALRFQGAKDAPPDSEIVWADPQTHTPGTITDSVAKQYLARLIPRSVALAKLGYTQTEIRQILATPDDQFAPEAVVQQAGNSVRLGDVTRGVPPGS